MIGTTLAHYTITAKLGSGGMGDVYRAEDGKLGREVALKVLPAKMAEDAARLGRFRREARAVAALNHPNIVTLYSVEEADGTHFLTMELVDGHTLAGEIRHGGLPLERFFDIASALASAVAAAHVKGITHRDLKPANVMLTSDGRVKVLDFGLAKLIETAEPADRTQLPTEALTQEGLVMGTIPYMSPEQVEGKSLDQRTDIFSLGVLLYEMVTGARPFQGDTQPALMSSILRDAPRQVIEVRTDLPRHLGRILHRCLEKSPQHRYQSAGSLAYELAGLQKEYESGSASVVHATPSPRAPAPSTPGPAAAGPANGTPRDVASGVAGGPAPAAGADRSIAVLPFLNRSADPDDQYFSDGLSEELINALSKIPGIKVTARSSAFQFRGQEIDVREVGRRLGVEAVLEGSVRIAGPRLRITTELVSCADGYQIWSERFDSEMKDVFDTQDEIAQAIVEQLEVELGGKAKEPLVKRETENLEAWHLLLKARHHMADFWEPGLLSAIESLEQAIELDPGYAQAYADMSFCYLVRSIFGTLPGKDAFPQIRSAALRALEIDPEQGDAHAMLGVYLGWHDRDWEKAEKEALLGLRYSPHNVWNRFYYSAVLATMRRGDEAVVQMAKACELDPLNRVLIVHHALMLFYAGRNDDAAQRCLDALKLFPDFWFILYLQSFIYWKRRDGEAAVASILRAIELTDDRIPFLACLAAAIHFYFDRLEEGERWLARVEEMSVQTYVTPMGRSLIEVARQRTDEAISWIERAAVEQDTLFAWTRAFCEQQDIIADEGIRETMERLGLP